MGTHLFFTLKLRIPQRRIGKALLLSVTPEKQNGSGRNLSSFGALATTLAATLGTGNIIGVSTAVALGGPGAVFWCWLTGILGMATSYAECYLSVLYKEKNEEGLFVGGPMYVLKNGLHHKALAKFYALSTVCAAFGVGCTTQANSLTQTTSSTWGLSPHLVGIAAAFISGLVILGGIRSIGNICMKIVPVLGEAGIGTSAIPAAASGTKNPSRQAYISMTAVFWDTVVMCLLSGLVIVANMLKHPESLLHVNETGLADAAFSYLPFGGSQFLSLALAAFAITTLIGWSYLINAVMVLPNVLTLFLLHDKIKT